MSNADSDGIQVLAELRDNKEYGDPVPVAPPIGMRRMPSMAERIQRMVRDELSKRAEAVGAETFEEANDFDVPDDPVDPNTPYEQEFDPVEAAAQERLRTGQFKDMVEERVKQYRKSRGQEVRDGQSTGSGVADVVERRSSAGEAGSGKPGEVVEDERGEKPRVQGGRGKAGVGDPRVED